MEDLDFLDLITPNRLLLWRANNFSVADPEVYTGLIRHIQQNGTVMRASENQRLVTWVGKPESQAGGRGW